MKKTPFCNPFFQFRQHISDEYDRQARAFQKEYNLSHPDQHLWRHILYKRTFRFFKNGQAIPVDLEIVRFIYAGTNSTFTFYGSLFLPFFRFPITFMEQAVCSPSGTAAMEVSADTVSRWGNLGLFSDADTARPPKPHNPCHGFSSPVG